MPAVTSAWSAWLQHDRAREAQQDIRDARLFEHRREAYARFVAESNGLASRYNRHFMDDEALDLGADPLRSVIDRAALVQLYGTAEAAELADFAWSALAKYIRHGREEGGLVFDFQVVLDRFINQARADLGVPETPSVTTEAG
ncbi:hypothetical protein [Nocardioides exalbidus]|uniref:hypothetical protein n=1 Tax=Nocardioides exalbidus TaxID=402596 RepID=UPI001115223C|nr:hypothetical protein [Nocardioides exalbidus]